MPSAPAIRLIRYATRLTTDFAGETAVEVSASGLNETPDASLVLVKRDAGRAEAMGRPGFGLADDWMGRLMERFGTSTLKDIVAEKTDVVEKICIVTVVELTRNNRMAAAEIPGQSRQSLYVKLWKNALLSRDPE